MRSTFNKLMRTLEAEGIKITNPKTGVRWFHQSKKWQVVIKVNGVTKSLGYFQDLYDAIQARNDAENKYFPEGRQPKRTKKQPEAVSLGQTVGVTVVSPLSQPEDDAEDDSLEAEFYN